MNISIKVQGLEAVKRKLNDLERNHVRFATARALTKTAGLVKEAMVKEVDKVFDRPTPYTRNAFMIKPATKATWRQCCCSLSRRGTSGG